MKNKNNAAHFNVALWPTQRPKLGTQNRKERYKRETVGTRGKNSVSKIYGPTNKR